ncbi:CRTAC1 family protein [Allorhodopirellula solitaria]|uniref:FG-GAP repeat protein n=1 Tax=Allorhodopirellula solitaria TaxID=2527987 RepID=A0A5C5XNT2_9BACT|nr:CRTAC1 family protein [Allorhodopirellula solitaria]TWT64856.1 FG-GAP repeat protein [Allorhodopirellula solitaria]
MNDPTPSKSQKPETRQPRWSFGWGVAAIVVAVLLAITAWILLRRGEDEARQAPADASATVAQLEVLRSALAATENLDLRSADESWSTLHQQSPEDASIALDRAINRVLLVDDLAAQANNPALDAEAKTSVRSQLPKAIAAARDSVDDAARVTEDQVTPLWLQTRVDLHEAALLPASMTKSLRREIMQRLVAAVQGEMGEDPRSMILGGSLIEVLLQMEDPIDGLPEDVRSTASRTLATLSDQHPDNLFFALRAARLNIESQQQQAAKYAQRSAELTRAIEPSLARDIRALGVTPTELVGQITSAIDAGQWPDADASMMQWFNVLNGTELVKTDRRRASPHPLDRLSFDTLRRLSADLEAVSPIQEGSEQATFSVRPLGSEDVSIIQSIDFDLDMDADIITLTSAGRLQLWQNDGGDSWSAAGELALDMEATGMIAADMFVVDSSSPQRLRSGESTAGRHDTFLNLVVYGDAGVRIVRIDGRENLDDQEDRLAVVSEETGLEEVRSVTAAVAGDLEADGDLDLVLATEEDGVRMFCNRGNRTFFELPGSSDRFAGGDPVTAMAIADIDRDLDLDIITTQAASGQVGILENLLHLQFRARAIPEIPPVPGAFFVAVEDVDANVSWDLIVSGPTDNTIVYSQTADAGAWTVDRVESSATQSPAEAIAVADIDNDSWLEIIRCTAGELMMSRIGPWGFGDWTPVVSDSDQADVSTIATGDFSGDGTIDLAVVNNAQAEVWENRIENAAHFLDVRFKGIDDNASGRVNHFAIGSVLEARFGPHYRARIVTTPSTHFGIDGFEQADSIRAILPNGLTQTIRNPPVDMLVEEEQTLKGSCPYLYAFDGERFRFVTDCLWAAPLGLQVADGIVAKDRPWEYLKIDGREIRPRDGRYEFRITEELWEVAYFDEVKLTAIDHPANVEVWTNEKVGPGQIATPTIFAFADTQRIAPTLAVDTEGRDVTEKLGAADREFVQGFDRRLRQGLCPPHWIDLDFGDLPGDAAEPASQDKVYLVLTGWIMPTDTSLNIQIDQNPELSAIEFPSLWVPDTESPEGWRNAIPFIGFPGGKTKTIVVDVSDVISRDDSRVRIRTSAQIYWDAAELVVQETAAEYIEQPLALESASVGFHGFSSAVRADPTHPETYRYDDVSEQPRWPPLRGKVTRFGDCLELLRDWDDEMVVIGAGDEIRLKFAEPDQALPEGWVRDFVMHNVGWDKDADLNTLAGQQIGPLPYREMKSYPPGPDGAAQSEARYQINADHLQRTQSFREFWARE